MGRLTERDKHEQGIWVDTQEIGDLDKWVEPFEDIYPAINKLAHYEDLEEQGRLIELPCAVGDTVYLVDVEEQVYDEAKVDEIVITKDGIELNSDYEIGTLANADYVAYDIDELAAMFKELEGE